MEDLHRVLDVDDDDALLEDPTAVALQREAPPPGVSPETHDLVLKTIRGGEAWKATRDAELEALRQKRLQELKRPAPGPRTVGAEALVECLRLAKSFVVVHVTDGGPDCRAVDAALAGWEERCRRGDSRGSGTVLRLEAAEAAGHLHEVDPEALPAVLVYLDDDLVGSKLRAPFRDADDLEDYLEDLGLFG